MTTEAEPKKKKKQTRKSLSLPGAVYDRAKSRCDGLGVPLAAKVQALVEAWLESSEPKRKRPASRPALPEVETNERPTVVDRGPVPEVAETWYTGVDLALEPPAEPAVIEPVIEYDDLERSMDDGSAVGE
jgi:hypothetical protein